MPVLTCNYRYKLLFYIVWADSLLSLTFCTTYLDEGHDSSQISPEPSPQHIQQLYAIVSLGGGGPRMFLSGNSAVIFFLQQGRSL